MFTRDNHICPNNTQARQAGVENHAVRRQLARARRELNSARRILARSYAQVAKLRAEQNADAAKVKQVCAENDKLKAGFVILVWRCRRCLALLRVLK